MTSHGAGLDSPGGVLSGIALSGFGLAIASVLVAMLSGIGYRLGWWDFGTGFSILGAAAVAALLAAILSLVGMIVARPRGRRRGLGFAIFGLALALAVVAVPASWWRTAREVPPIHDISTDTDNPPLFVAILPLREDASNPVEYGGAEVAAQQRKAYPDVQPLVLPIRPAQAFEHVLAAARGLGWGIVSAEPAEGRIEATDTTLWYGFKDDIVVRITSADQGSRIDVRSLSRVGRSDLGTNAARIRRFLRKIQSNDLG